MKILVAADMEGVTGVVNWDHVDSRHSEYGRFRRLMTGDVNAAIRGAFDGGAAEVIVSDGHGNSRNILIEELDPRARLNSGGPRLLGMVTGVDSVDAAMFVGYHARAHAQRAVLCHTWSRNISNVWLNGRLVGEIGLNAALCGHYDVPVILVAGDQTACAEAADLLGPIETAVVKEAASKTAAECLSPQAAQQRIFEAAKRGVERLRAGDAPEPLHLQLPVTLTVQLAGVDMADKASIVPSARRLEDNRVEFTAEDVVLAFRYFRIVTALVQ